MSRLIYPLIVAIVLVGVLRYCALPDEPHKHKQIGEPYCIGHGTLCDSMRYCETTGKRIIFKNTHVSLTKEDSSKYKLGKFK